MRHRWEAIIATCPSQLVRLRGPTWPKGASSPSAGTEWGHPLPPSPGLLLLCGAGLFPFVRQAPQRGTRPRPETPEAAEHPPPDTMLALMADALDKLRATYPPLLSSFSPFFLSSRHMGWAGSGFCRIKGLSVGKCGRCFHPTLEGPASALLPSSLLRPTVAGEGKVEP